MSDDVPVEPDKRSIWESIAKTKSIMTAAVAVAVTPKNTSERDHSQSSKKTKTISEAVLEMKGGSSKERECRKSRERAEREARRAKLRRAPSATVAQMLSDHDESIRNKKKPRRRRSVSFREIAKKTGDTGSSVTTVDSSSPFGPLSSAHRAPSKPVLSAKKRLSFNTLMSDPGNWSAHTCNHMLILILVAFMQGYCDELDKFNKYSHVEVDYEPYGRCLREGFRDVSGNQLQRLGIDENLFQHKTTFLDALDFGEQEHRRLTKTRFLIQKQKSGELWGRAVGMLLSLVIYRSSNRSGILLGVMSVLCGYALITAFPTEEVFVSGYFLVYAGHAMAYIFALLNSFDSMSYWSRLLCFTASTLSNGLGATVSLCLIYAVDEWTFICGYLCLFTLVILVFVHNCTKKSHSEILLSLNLRRIMRLFGLKNNSTNRNATERLLEATLYNEHAPKTFPEYCRLVATNKLFIVNVFFYVFCSMYTFYSPIHISSDSVHLHLPPIESELFLLLSRSAAALVAYISLRWLGLRATLVVSFLLVCSAVVPFTILSRFIYDDCIDKASYSHGTADVGWDAHAGFLSDSWIWTIFYLLHIVGRELDAAALTIWFFEWVPPTIRRHTYFIQTLLMLVGTMALFFYTYKIKTNIMGYDQLTRALSHALIIPLFFYFFRYNGAMTFYELEGQYEHADSEDDECLGDAEKEFRKKEDDWAG